MSDDEILSLGVGLGIFLTWASEFIGELFIIFIRWIKNGKGNCLK